MIFKLFYEKIRNFFMKLGNMFYLLKLFIKYKKFIIILIFPHIGDIFYSLPFINEFEKNLNNEINGQHKKEKKIILIGNKKYEKIYNLFNGIDELYLTNDITKYSFIYFKNFKFMRKLIMKKINNKSIVNNDWYYMQKFFPMKENEGLFNYTKRVIYGLDENTKIDMPKIESKKSLSENKYIIISPYAQSIKQIDFKEYSNIVETLKKKGYEIYTNAHGKEKELEGTKKLDCSLIELCEYANSAEAFIGLRSGICDMIAAMTNVKMYVLFNNYEFRYAYKLDDFRKINGAPLKQYFEDDNQLYFRDIINELDNSK